MDLCIKGKKSHFVEWYKNTKVVYKYKFFKLSTKTINNVDKVIHEAGGKVEEIPLKKEKNDGNTGD